MVRTIDCGYFEYDDGYPICGKKGLCCNKTEDEKCPWFKPRTQEGRRYLTIDKCVLVLTSCSRCPLVEINQNGKPNKCRYPKRTHNIHAETDIYKGFPHNCPLTEDFQSLVDEYKTDMEDNKDGTVE